jgi:hypothetical protein
MACRSLSEMLRATNADAGASNPGAAEQKGSRAMLNIPEPKWDENTPEREMRVLWILARANRPMTRDEINDVFTEIEQDPGHDYWIAKAYDN